MYVQTDDGVFHDLTDDTPVRGPSGGGHGELRGCKPGDVVEVYFSPMVTLASTSWQRATVQAEPKRLDFVVSCVSFTDETEVWKALEDALRKFPLKPNSVSPWMKIIPPSRRTDRGPES